MLSFYGRRREKVLFVFAHGKISRVLSEEDCYRILQFHCCPQAGEALGLKLNDPDGDSFPVECHAMLASTEPDDIHSGGEFLKELRLYSVDAPESAFKTYGRGESNKARIDDQAVYFG